jgi:tubulin polyglutamylase TTLL9
MDWDVHWADREWISEHYDHVHFEQWQRINHFRNCRELCRKDLMYRNVVKFKRALERAKKYELAAQFDFCPATFVLPNDYALFVEEFRRRSHITWIMKPIGSAQGKGIFLFKKLAEIREWRDAYKNRNTRMQRTTPTGRGADDDEEKEKKAPIYVVQRYLAKPYLVGGKKFDMRIYALVTSYQPLTCYLYRRGFARFSATRYDGANLSDTSVHLTNVAVQKKGKEYNRETGGKWFLRDLKMYMRAKHGHEATNRAFYDVQSIILRSLEAVQNVMINDKHCFELYGYDIMFDSNLKPWLLEVNASPSLTANTPEDYALKFQMLNEMFDIIDMERVRAPGATVAHLGGFDAIYREHELDPYPGSFYDSLLGAEVPEPPPRTESKKRPHAQGSGKEGEAGGRKSVAASSTATSRRRASSSDASSRRGRGSAGKSKGRSRTPGQR